MPLRLWKQVVEMYSVPKALEIHLIRMEFLNL